MIKPFLKWAGGKTRVLPELLPMMPKGDCLIEPFVGGGAVFLNTEYKHYILADINPDLINVYHTVKNRTCVFIEVARELFKNGNSKDYYLKVREDFNVSSSSLRQARKPVDRLSLMQAARFLYLNRHGFNGVCRYNGKLAFNVPFGLHKSAPYFPEKEIRQFAEKANDTRAVFMHLPFEHTIQLIANHASPVIYCDPPYLPASDTADFTTYYGQTFTPDHHRQLVQALLTATQRHHARVVISNSDTPATREIYAPFRLREISVKRSVSANATTRGGAQEVIGVLPICHYCGEIYYANREHDCPCPSGPVPCPSGGCGNCDDAYECLGLEGCE